jgi:DNA replication protein DnaC
MRPLAEVIWSLKTKLEKQHDRRDSSETSSSALATTYRCAQCHDVGWTWVQGNAFACLTCHQVNIRNARIAQSGIPANRWDQWTFATFRPDWDADPKLRKPGENPMAGKILEAAQSYIGQQWPQVATPWLAFVGNSGNGKSHISGAIVRELIERGIGARFYVFAEMLDELYETFNKHQQDRDQLSAAQLMSYWEDVEVMAIDDIREDDLSTEFKRGRLDDIANRRYERAQPMIITSNLALDALPPRFASRLRDRDICRLVVCNGPDARPYVPRLRMGGEGQ